MKRLPLLLVMLAACAASGAPPQRVTLQYDMSRNGASMVEVTETLVHDGRSYFISSEAKGKGVFALADRGSARRSSRGSIDAQGLKPAEFRDQRGGGPQAVARFDWAEQKLMQQFEGRDETISLSSRVQDRLSFLYEFAFAPPSGRDIDVTVTDGRGTTRFRYKSEGRKTVKTPGGEFEALHLVKQRDGPGDRATEIWLATRRNYLPVRILVVEKDGTRIDQVLTRIGN